MITVYRRPDAPTDPAALFAADFTFVYAPDEGEIGCELTGPRHPSQWADEQTPIYLDVFAALTLPAVVEALPPTRPLPLAELVGATAGGPRKRRRAPRGGRRDGKVGAA